MTEDRKQHITLQLDAHHISLNVPASKEAVYRAAGETLNKRYRYYQHKMPTRSAEQVWVYVALEMAVNLNANAFAHGCNRWTRNCKPSTNCCRAHYKKTINHKQQRNNYA